MEANQYWTTKQQAALQQFLELSKAAVNFEKLDLTAEEAQLDKTTHENYEARIAQLWPKVRSQAEEQGFIVDDPLQFALKRFKSDVPGKVLAYLSPDRIVRFDGYETTCHLDTTNLQLQHILRCWRYRDGQWEEFSPEQYLEHQSVVGSHWTEFSILEKQNVAYIVWQWLVLVLKGRYGGSGGTLILKKIGDDWIVLPNFGDTWRI